MADGGFDYAVCGATPFAGLLAGLLALVHGKRVCLIGETWSPYRLPRGFDVSVMPATRPETWALLKREGAETMRLLGTIGRGLYERVDPLFVAETRANADRLGHMRWMASGFGFAAERAVDRTLTTTGTICRIRDAAMLVTGKVEPAIEAWLAKAEVRRVRPADAMFTFRRDGASLVVRGNAAEIGTVVLADDEAILDRLAPADRHRLIAVRAATSVLSEPAKPLSAALIHYLDRDVALHQRATKGPITALAAGEPDTALARIGASLGPIGPLKRAGQAQFRRVETLDGAPLIGRAGRGKAMTVAGLGDSAAFIAPVVARVLAGAASAEEQRYFEARDISKAANRQAVAEMAS